MKILRLEIIKKNKIENYLHFLILLVSVIFLFYPFHVKESQIRRQNSNLSTSLKTTTFRDSITVSIGSFGPLLMDCFIDYLQFGEKSQIFFLTRVFPIVTLILTSFLMLYFVCNDGNSSLYYSLFNAELVTLLCFVLCYLQETSSSIWTNWRLCFCFGSFCSCLNFRDYEGHVLYFGDISGIVSFISFISSFTTFFYIYILWYLKYVYTKVIFKDTGDDLFISWMYMNVIFCLYIIMSVWLYMYGGMPMNSVGVEEITRQNYSLTAAALFVGSLISRRLRNVVVKAKVTPNDISAKEILIVSFHICSNLLR